ncbi:MAG: hypothetical protein SW833_11540 [Cyanobacteriota bacterium]|nr:hypothetical protein [Cyanobacteriota bacterium]
MLVARCISTAFVLSTAIVGFSQPLQAQSNQNPTPNRSVTLSGDSLVDVENRTTQEDYRYFFPGNAPISADGNDEIAPNSSEPVVFQIDSQYELIFNSQVEYPEYVDLFRSPGDTNASQSVRVKFPVGEGSQE